jgi:transcriptional regulator
MSNEQSLIAGSLGAIILRIADRGDTYGYAIAKEVEKVTEGAVVLKEGSLYPALQRLERSGFLESYDGISENGRRRRYYRITRAGRDSLQEEREAWRAFREAVSGVLGAED